MNSLNRPMESSANQTRKAANPTPYAPTTGWKRLLWIALLVWMVLSFTTGALTKFYWGPTFGPAYSVKFVEWGYPSWFRFVVGSGEIVAAALLCIPRYRIHAGLILAVILTGATITHIVNHNTIGQSTAAPVHLVLAGVILWCARPASWRDVLTRLRPGGKEASSSLVSRHRCL